MKYFTLFFILLLTFYLPNSVAGNNPKLGGGKTLLLPPIEVKEEPKENPIEGCRWVENSSEYFYQGQTHHIGGSNLISPIICNCFAYGIGGGSVSYSDTPMVLKIDSMDMVCPPIEKGGELNEY